MDNDKEKELNIDLGKVFLVLRKKIIYIILGTLICAVLSGCITKFFIDPKYSTSCTMYVYSNTDRASSDSSIGQSEITASQKLVNTYITVLESDLVLEQVAKELNLNMSANAIKSMLSCSQINETEIFRVTVTSRNAQLSANVANAIAQVAPDAIVEKIKAGGVEIIDYAKVPTNPSAPDLKRNVVVGAIAGFIMSFLSLFIYAILDNTIRNEKDIERVIDIPILGTIPHLVASSEKDINNVNSESKTNKMASKKGEK